jgi:hypothetical protein
VTETSSDLLDDIAARLLADHGFRLRPSASTLVGTCPRCARTDAPERARKRGGG